MAKSLKELQLVFEAQYPRTKGKQPEEYKIDTTIVEEIKKEKLKEAEKKVKQEQQKQEQPKNEEADSTKDKKKSKASVISDIIFYMALVSMVIFAVLFSRGAFGEQTFGGYRFYEVLTTSMDSVYPRGSLVLIKTTDASELIVGDDITFTRGSGDLITHRIIEIKENYEGSGSRGFVTKGVDNAAPDEDTVLAESVVGKVVKGFSGLGATLSWLGSNLWIVLVLFLSLMAMSFFLKLLWREKKKIKARKNDEKQIKEDIKKHKKEE